MSLQDSDIKRLAGPMRYLIPDDFAEVGNRMGTARRCNLARLFLTLRGRQHDLKLLVRSNPEGVQILIRVRDPVLFH
jgi:hypothetical protein